MNGFLEKVVPSLAGAVSGEKPAPAWCAGSRCCMDQAVGGSGMDQVSGLDFTGRRRAAWIRSAAWTSPAQTLVLFYSFA